MSVARHFLLSWVLWSAVSACTSMLPSAVRPADLGPDARPLVYEHPMFSWSGAQVDGLVLDGGPGGMWGSAGLHVWTAHASTAFRILDREKKVQWTVDCDATLDSARRPNTWLICRYEPTSGQRPPMTLALTADGERPLAGAFLVNDDVWYVDGDRATVNRGDYPDTIGWTLRREPVGAALVWMDVAIGWPEVWVAPQLASSDVSQIAPLVLTFPVARDPRAVFRRDGASFAPDDDATRFPEPGPAASPTVARLQALSLSDAAAVLAFIEGRRTAP